MSGRASARTLWVIVSIAGLAGSLVALGSAPILMPEDYSWVANTVSESGAQGVSGAWLARLGLCLLGLSVLLVAHMRAGDWPALATPFHVAFGASLTGAAAFSTRPWRPDAAFDRTEDLLHSVAATTVGFAFTFGVVAVVALDWRRVSTTRRALGLTAATAAVVLPLGMWLWPAAQGALQRSMFALAYLWYATEARSARR